MRRGVLVGTAEKIEEFTRSTVRAVRTDHHSYGDVPEEALGLTPPATPPLREALRQTVDLVRSSNLDDVFVLLPWSATHAVSHCADRLMTIPASVHLGPEAIFDPVLRHSPVEARRGHHAQPHPPAAELDRGFVEAVVRYRTGDYRIDPGGASARDHRHPDQIGFAGTGLLPPKASRLQPQAIPHPEVPHHDGGRKMATRSNRRR